MRYELLSCDNKWMVLDTVKDQLMIITTVKEIAVACLYRLRSEDQDAANHSTPGDHK